ncbi:hypothetical protein A1D23_10055 [Chelonobacter oris]|nr:hypothetical protein [Chelonobacter oris]
MKLNSIIKQKLENKQVLVMSREQQILELLRKDPLIPQQQIADILGLSRSSVAGYIMNLMRKGQIRGKGYILSPQQRVVTIGGTNMDIAGYTGEIKSGAVARGN